MSAVASLLALLAALMVVAAYPAKDDEAYYYNRLQDLSDNQKTRNLDGIDSKDDAWPGFVAKTDQGGGSEKGAQTKFQSGSHIDGIGGGHLVRNLEHEQGLGHALVDVSQQSFFDVDDYKNFGIVSISRLLSPLGENNREKNWFIELVGRPKWVANTFPKRHLLETNNDLNSVIRETMFNDKRDLDALGGGHLLKAKRYLDALEDGLSLENKRHLESLGKVYPLEVKRLIRSLMEKDFVQTENIFDALERIHNLSTKRNLDSIGGGHLLDSKRSVNNQ